MNKLTREKYLELDDKHKEIHIRNVCKLETHNFYTKDCLVEMVKNLAEEMDALDWKNKELN